MNELPSISNSNHLNTSYYAGTSTTIPDSDPYIAAAAGWVGPSKSIFQEDKPTLAEKLQRHVMHKKLLETEAMAEKPSRRIVQVFVIDPDSRIPLDKCILFHGDQKMTDSTDQELFFDIDIKALLTQHNAYRITLDDEKSTLAVLPKLKPVAIRDLVMNVVTIAKF